ncbi:MAG TPA: HNH endonuclease [Anaeromyxobacteraceae bacterium]|nr:HNH endonuclease [Anaeromyxobacteraceae bacterium]
MRLATLPAAPSVDFMAGEDGRIYSRLRHKGFGRWEYVDWHPVGGGRRQRDGTLVIDVGGRRVSLVVAQVVCAAFHGIPPGDSCRVRHLDGDPANNRAENLAWGTEQEAWADEHPRRLADGGLRSARRLSHEDRVHLRWAVAVGLCSQRQAARVLGVALSTVQAIVREKPKGAG